MERRSGYKHQKDLFAGAPRTILTVAACFWAKTLKEGNGMVYGRQSVERFAKPG